jgi:hypothetical protein
MRADAKTQTAFVSEASLRFRNALDQNAAESCAAKKKILFWLEIPERWGFTDGSALQIPEKTKVSYRFLIINDLAGSDLRVVSRLSARRSLIARRSDSESIVRQRHLITCKLLKFILPME